jgi:ABC-type antimicrobial peptide transport system permease subunit
MTCKLLIFFYKLLFIQMLIFIITSFQNYNAPFSIIILQNACHVFMIKLMQWHVHIMETSHKIAASNGGQDMID